MRTARNRAHALIAVASLCCTAALRLPQLPRWPGAIGAVASEENGIDEKYPWRFDGRLWFRPSLVRVPETLPPGDVKPVALFGWTVGGVVCLEYDEAPTGQGYREYATMGTLVAKRGTVGQWGRRLFVGTPEAEALCERVWDWRASSRDIRFIEDGATLRVDSPPACFASEEGPRPEPITVSGWAAIRHAEADGERLTLPFRVLWTPTIGALWAPLVPLPPAEGAASLPLHELQLSFGSARLHSCGQAATEGSSLGLPLPVGLSLDRVRIEISRELSSPL